MLFETLSSVIFIEEDETKEEKPSLETFHLVSACFGKIVYNFPFCSKKKKNQRVLAISCKIWIAIKNNLFLILSGEVYFATAECSLQVLFHYIASNHQNRADFYKSLKNLSRI